MPGTKSQPSDPRNQLFKLPTALRCSQHILNMILVALPKMLCSSIPGSKTQPSLPINVCFFIYIVNTQTTTHRDTHTSHRYEQRRNGAGVGATHTCTWTHMHTETQKDQMIQATACPTSIDGPSCTWNFQSQPPHLML